MFKMICILGLIAVMGVSSSVWAAAPSIGGVVVEPEEPEQKPEVTEPAEKPADKTGEVVIEIPVQ